MEFFCCPCPGEGVVVLNGNDQGSNMEDEKPRTLMCGSGLHRISLTCLVGRTCAQSFQEVDISGTNPILPLEVPFQCAP